MRNKFRVPFSLLGLSCSALLFAITACSRAPQVPPKTVEITADDKMKYSLTEFDVSPGQKVVVMLKNVGTSPKMSMGHNFIVLNKNVKWTKFVEDASTDAAHEYVPPALAKDVLAHTKLLGPGESDSVTFTAPYVPGPYDYVCSFPGHATQGMKGVMTVKQ